MLLINKTLLKMSKGIRHWILFIAGLKIVIMMATIEVAKIIAEFLGDLYNPSMTTADFKSSIVSALLASIVLVIGNVLLGEAEYFCSAKARLSLRDKIFSKLFEVDISNIEKIGAVNAINCSGQGVENMQIYYSKYLPTIVFCVVSPIYVFWQLWGVSAPSAILLAVVSFCILPLNNIFKKLTEKLKGDYWQSLSGMTGHYLENLKGITTVKIFNRDQDKSDSLRVKVDDFNKKIMNVMKLNFCSVGLSYTLIYLATFISIIIACNQLANEVISFSAALTVLMLSFSFFASFKDLMGATHSALSGISAAQNIHDLFEIDTSREQIPMENTKDEKSGITLKNVVYAYPNRATVLKDININIPKNKVTALVGSSGCGKSTVASLLLRFIDPVNGYIQFEGIDYRCYTPDVLRKNISIVPQSVFIFSGTIEENLKIANKNASETDMLKALENVHLKDWFENLKDGFKTDVGDNGSKLSGGQKQKIGIARALLSSAQYIVLDEATSSVDIESEKEIWSCIDNLSKRKTLVIISHRLSTIKNADVIYVFDKGTIENSGLHEELMGKSPFYSKLVNEQAIFESEEVVTNG